VRLPLLAFCLPLAACVAAEPATVQETVIGPGATEADFVATLSDAELYPDLTPEGAALMRRIEWTEGIREEVALEAMLADWPCDRPVTDETMDDFVRAIGVAFAEAVGFPQPDWPLVAQPLGEKVVFGGAARMTEDPFLYDDDTAIVGLARCA
jgi:hypothetical protein